MQPINRRDMVRLCDRRCPGLREFTLRAFGLNERASEETVIPFLDAQPVDPKRPMVKWQELTSWITPNEEVFAVSHYGTPKVDLDHWKLEISGLIKSPKALTLADLKKRPRKTVTATLECSGNSSSPTFMGAVGNVRWTGTPLGPLLQECGLHRRSIEAVFFGHDEKVEKIREQDYAQNFARSLSLRDAFREEVLLAYEMNGKLLPPEHGAPLR